MSDSVAGLHKKNYRKWLIGYRNWLILASVMLITRQCLFSERMGDRATRSHSSTCDCKKTFSWLTLSGATTKSPTRVVSDHFQSPPDNRTVSNRLLLAVWKVCGAATYLGLYYGVSTIEATTARWADQSRFTSRVERSRVASSRRVGTWSSATAICFVSIAAFPDSVPDGYGPYGSLGPRKN